MTKLTPLKKMPQAASKPDEFSTALTLLEKILESGTNENRRYRKYCTITMKSPIELHKTDCTWRIAWEFVNKRKP